MDDRRRAELEDALSPQHLASSFMSDRGPCSADNPAIDFEAVRNNFGALKNDDEALKFVAVVILEKVLSVDHVDYAEPQGCASAEDVTLLHMLPLRTLLILLEFTAMQSTDEPWCRGLIIGLGLHLMLLKKDHHLLFGILTQWLTNDSDLFGRTVKTFHSGFVSLRRSRDYREVSTIIAYVSTLRLLNQINEENNCIVPPTRFYINGLEKDSNSLRLHALYFEMESIIGPMFFTWLDASFLLNVRTKWTLLSLAAELSQRISQLQSYARYVGPYQAFHLVTLMGQMGPGARGLLPGVADTLVFEVSRGNVVQAAMRCVDRYWTMPPRVWQLPLEVRFEGEYAIDLGGPSKEFFRLLFEALMDTENLHIFKKLDEKSISSDVWFNPDYVDLLTLQKIGLLFALLIYNGQVVTVPFPLLLYKKLLIFGKRVSMEGVTMQTSQDLLETMLTPQDLREIDPDFVQRLHSLRDLPAAELEAVTLDFRGLQIDGEHIDVDSENLESYIEATEKRQLAVGQFASFIDGFWRMYKIEDALSTRITPLLFKPEELRDVILGENLDWAKFEASTSYEAPYSVDHPVIRRFWRVFHGLEEREKRQFLKVQTGADHVPICGFESLQYKIRRLDNTRERFLDPTAPNGHEPPGNLCPEVMTCRGFVSMDLPEYETDNEARFRLLKLLEFRRGFHRENPC